MRHSQTDGGAATHRVPLSSLGKGSLKSGPDHAMCVHRVIDRRHHAEKGMDHTGKLLVLDRHAGMPQGIGVARTIIVQNEGAVMRSLKP